MRKVLVSVAALVTAVAVAVPAARAQSPQTTVTAEAKVTPGKAGTKRKPQGVKLNVRVEWSTPGDAEKPVVQQADVLFPKGSLYNGGKYAKCDAAKMNRNGLDVCPKNSIMGSGTASAYADTVMTYPKITVVNGGGSSVCLWTVMTNPARVSACVPGKITKMSGKWAYKLHLDVPRNLQLVAGVPIALKTFNVTAGGKSHAKDWLATTSCPSGGWDFSVETFFSTGGSGTFEDSVDCS